MGRRSLVRGVSVVWASKPVGELEKLGYDEATAKRLHDELSILADWRTALTRARALLRNDVRIDSVIHSGQYLDFAKRVWWAIHDYGLSEASSHVKAYYDLYVSLGCNSDVLAGLAKLQGVTL